MKKYIFAMALMLLIGITAFTQTKIQSDSIKKHVFFLSDESLEGRGFSTDQGFTAAMYIAENFRKIGLNAIGDDYLHPFYFRVNQTMLSGNNVIGIIEGTDPEKKDEYIVLGAHFDHIAYDLNDDEKVVYRGADDNASGSSALIEIARALVSSNIKLKRSIAIVAFDGEESGLIGSSNFLSNNIIPNENIKLMINLDMIGNYSEFNTLYIGADENIKSRDESLFALAQKYDLTIKKEKKKMLYGSDADSFEEYGIPTLFFNTGIGETYHTQNDNLETIDFDGIEKISNLVFDYINDAANQTILEPTTKFERFVKSEGLPFFRYGVKTNIGGSHHYYPTTFFNGKSKFSSEAGLLTQFKISNYFSLQPEVLYSTLSSGNISGNIRNHSICIPVSLYIGTKLDPRDKYRLFLTFGGYYSYHFSGSLNNEPIDFTNTYKQTETGLVYSFGFEIMSVVVGMNFKNGLTNIMSDASAGEYYSHATYFSIAYLF